MGQDRCPQVHRMYLASWSVGCSFLPLKQNIPRSIDYCLGLRGCKVSGYRYQPHIIKNWSRKGGDFPGGDFPGVLVVKNPLSNAGDIRDVGSIPRLGRSLGGGHGNPLQCSCLENPMDRGAWPTTAHRVLKSRAWLSDLAACMAKSSIVQDSRLFLAPANLWLSHRSWAQNFFLKSVWVFISSLLVLKWCNKMHIFVNIGYNQAKYLCVQYFTL